MENLNLAQKEYLVDTEYNADLVGLLLGDEYFIEKLANRNLPLVEKIFKGLKNLNKKSAAVDKASAKYLNKLVNKFGKAIDNAHGGVSIKSLGGTDEEKVEQGEVEEKRYSIVKDLVDTEGTHYGSAVLLDTSFFDGTSPRLWGKALKKYLENKVSNDTFIMPIVDENGKTQKLEFARLNDRVSKNDNNEHKVINKLTNTTDNISKLAVIHIDEIVDVSTESTPYWSPSDGHAWLDGNGWLHRKAYVINSKNNAIFEITMDIAKAVDGRVILYSLNGKTKRIGNANVNSTTKIVEGSRQNTYSNKSISENSEKINTFDKKIDDERKSISKSVDSEGNSLSAEQAEYFKDSKVRDENGNLLVVYHGTRKADFTVFKRNVNFFTDNVEMAESYSPNGEKYKGYLNISNPLVIDACAEKWSRIPIDYELKGLLDAFGSSTFKENGKWRTTPADIAAAIEEAIDEGEVDYDGIIIKNIDDTGSYYKNSDKIVANDYIVFKSNQFKNADNTAPTDNSDIRYSKSKNIDFAGEKGYNESDGIYSYEEYYNFGWARANDVLNEGQNQDYRTKFAQAVNGSKSFRKTSSGEFMIPVSDIYDANREGINNVIVYAKGTIDNPIITRVLIINSQSETILGEVRSDLYEIERRGIQQKTAGIFRQHYKADFGNDVLYRRYLSKLQGHNNRFGVNGGAGSRKATRIKSISFDDDGNVIDEVRYSKSKSERFMPARHTKMAMAEDLVKHLNGKIQLKDNEIATKLGVLGYENITAENAAEELSRLDAEIREYATSERAAYRESNKKDTSSVAKATPSPQGEGYKGAEDEENFRNLVENDPDEIKYRAAEKERKESEGALLRQEKLEAYKKLGVLENDIKMLENMEELAKMESILTVDPAKLEKTGKSPYELYTEWFNILGNNIKSDRFGNITLSNSTVRSEIRHGTTAAKLATIEAIPDVIEKGEIIFDREKQGGVKRFVVCAPIKIGDNDYYMGVMLQKDAQHQRLYLHNVVSMEIKREALASEKADLVTTGAQTKDDLSMTIILQNALKVKFSEKKVTTEFDEPEMSNEERRLMASAERVASGKDFFPRHAEMRPSNDESWDYWLSEVDRREGSVRKLKNGKVKVGMAQTANEVKLTKFINNKIMDKSYSNENVKSIIDKILSNSDIWGH